MIIERSQSRKRKYSSSTKTKLDVQLPKINKTTILLKDKQKQNNSIVTTNFVDKVSWVIETKDYSTLNEKQIMQQYNRLRKQLQNINIEVEKAVEKIDFRIVKKNKMSEHDPIRTLQISDKQVQNNNGILDRLRKQNLQLQKRLASVTANSKDDIQQQITNTKQQIQKIKNKIKQLKMKNKNIGESIMSTDDIYEQIKRLQNQKQVNDRKKMKLQSKTQHIYQQISSSQLKLQEINDNFLIAQNFFQQYDGKNQQNEQQKSLQMKYHHAKHCLEVVNRKNQSTNNLKQQKYHILLKSLQAQVGKSNILQQKTASIQLQIIHCKKLIAEYQQIYKQNQSKRQLFNQQPVFFTQFETDPSDKNDKNSRSTKHDININNTLTNINSQRNKTQNKQNVTDDKSKNIIKQKNITKFNQQQKIKKQNERISTSNAGDLEQQQDIIVQLDQKFKYKTKTNMRNSRYNQKQTQIGEDLPEDIVDEDEQIMDFKSKVTEQKINRKSKQGFAIKQDMEKIKNQLQKMDFMKNNSQSFD